MPIDSERYNSSATRGDISGTTIKTCVALYAIADALEAISNGGKPTAEQVKKIRQCADGLNSDFDNLTGYTP